MKEKELLSRHCFTAVRVTNKTIVSLFLNSKPLDRYFLWYCIVGNDIHLILPKN